MVVVMAREFETNRKFSWYQIWIEFDCDLPGLVNKQLDPENHPFLMETSLPTPMTARVYVNIPEGTRLLRRGKLNFGEKFSGDSIKLAHWGFESEWHISGPQLSIAKWISCLYSRSQTLWIYPVSGQRGPWASDPTVGCFGGLWLLQKRPFPLKNIASTPTSPDVVWWSVHLLESGLLW